MVPAREELARLLATSEAMNLQDTFQLDDRHLCPQVGHLLWLCPQQVQRWLVRSWDADFGQA